MKYFLNLFLVLSFFLAVPFSQLHAQTSDQTAAPAGETAVQKQSRLQAELVAVEAEQAAAEKTLTEAKAQSSSLKKDIAVLTAQINVAQLNIKAKNLLIQTLGKDITQKQTTINTLQGKINAGHDTLAQILRKTNELDAVTTPEIVLSQRDLTDIFSDLDDFQAVQEALALTFSEIRTAKSQTETEKTVLDTRKSQENDALHSIQVDQANIKSAQAKKQQLLTVSKGNEATYSQVLAQKQKQAAQIRAALFVLRDTAAIPFGDALKYATSASKATGIRPAYLLAILTQESALGANVGSCYLTDQNTGAGVSVKTAKVFPNVMKPGRDIPPFLTITRALGLEASKTLVSCPQSVGWGGAMGPAQFIPSTWVLFEGRLMQALGTSITNPWNPQDAFMASAMYLTDLGARSGSYTGEQNAACKYYSGKSCSASSLVKSYGTSVMAHADTIQRTMIDPLQGV